MSLFGTGIRSASSLVFCNVGGITIPALYAGAQSQFPGLDQVNILLPEAVRGLGEVNVFVTAEGKASNPVRLAFGE